MAQRKKSESRRKTPWDSQEDNQMTPMQRFLRDRYQEHYAQRHPLLSDTGEVELINTVVPAQCPFCHAEQFSRKGHTKSGVQRYVCKCGKTFLPTTGTIFDGHKISISEWIEYTLNLFRYMSITADSWNNKNAFTTSKYWLEKIFLLLSDYQKDIVLSGTVWLDETYYGVRSSNIVLNEDGTKLRGLSRNQLCIGVAYDKEKAICFYEGVGKTSSKKTWDTFHNHIQAGSTLIHDEEQAHEELVQNLRLSSKSYNSQSLKNLDDKENPLNPVNQVHRLLQLFLYSHRSFMREELQGYLNLFSFSYNPPEHPLEKVEELLSIAFSRPITLRYRDLYSKNARKSGNPMDTVQ